MRTTLDLPDELLKKAKVAAIERGTTLREVVSVALSRELGVEPRPDSGRRARFPLIRSKRPGKLKLTNRIVGPLVRFQTVLSRMSRGEPVSEVRLRDGDLLVEFQDVFNDFLTNTDLARRAKEQRTLPPSSSPEPPRASVEETLLHDLRDLQMTTRRAVENKPAPPQRTN